MFTPAYKTVRDTLQLKMKNAITFPVLAAFHGVCAGCSGHGFRADADSDLISATEDDFFIIEYTTYSDESHKLAGTLDQVGIRNNSDSVIIVDFIELRKTFRGQAVNAETECMIYEHGDVFSGRQTHRTSITPGEWLYFVFPTAKIKEYRDGDRMVLDFQISMRSESKSYTNKVRLEKSIEKCDLPWM